MVHKFILYFYKYIFNLYNLYRYEKKVSLNDLPDKKSDSLSEQWTIAITTSMKKDINELETIYNKNMRKFIRSLIQEAIESVKQETKAG